MTLEDAKKKIKEKAEAEWEEFKRGRMGRIQEIRIYALSGLCAGSR